MTHQKLTSQELERILAAQPDAEKNITNTSEIPFVRQLISIDRALLSQLMTEQNYRRGEVVFVEGDIGDAAYLIWSGQVAVVKGDFRSPTILGYRGSGEIIGEMALIENLPRSASIIAIDKARLLRISSDNFHKLLDEVPSVGMDIMRGLSSQLRVANKNLSADAQTERQLLEQITELRTEKQQLEELQRVRQETSDLIIHDLRNPLFMISVSLNMLEITLSEDALADNREVLDSANSACRRMQYLIESLLDIARLENGQVQLRLSIIKLQNVIDNIADKMALSLKTADVVLRTAVPDNLPSILADEERIDRVITNLLDNAIKYTPKEGEITVTAALHDDRVMICVSDTGPGIPPEDRERIFERFAQGSRRDNKKRGFGLGLAYCRLAVEAHGGRIWVEPGENSVGSCFYFTLPTKPNIALLQRNS